MKELIKMKPNWTVSKSVFNLKKPNFIVVSNYEFFNEVNEWLFMSINDFNKSLSEIGMWHVKYKELKSK